MRATAIGLTTILVLASGSLGHDALVNLQLKGYVRVG
jgi:hypothetical protein